MCNSHCGRTDVIDGLSDLSSYLVSQVICWSQPLIPKPVATPPWWCFKLKSRFQQAAHNAHLSQSQGHELLEGIHSKQLLPWATEQSTWLQTLGLEGSPPSHFTLLSHLSACLLQKEPQHSELPPSLSNKPEASKCFYSTLQGYTLSSTHSLCTAMVLREHKVRNK